MHFTVNINSPVEINGSQKHDFVSNFTNIINSGIYWIRFKSISQQELDLPLAYAITAFTDPRKMELVVKLPYHIAPYHTIQSVSTNLESLALV